MTSHGIYTQLAATARSLREITSTAQKNVKALYAAGSIDGDAALIAELDELRALFEGAEASARQVARSSFEVAERYLKARQHAIAKDVEISDGSVSKSFSKIT